MMSWEKEASYIKGFAAGHGLSQTLISLQLAKFYHQGQTRKTGEPYIVHPIRVCSTLIALGVRDDVTLSSALLHDVIEDTHATFNALRISGLNEETCNIVSVLSKKKTLPTHLYYSDIGDYFQSGLAKIADRCNNTSTMAVAFSREKIIEYIQETVDYIYPLCKRVKTEHPQYSDAVFSMRYQIETTVNTCNAFLAYIDKNCPQKEA